jgi:hypothetical protein
VSSIVNTSEVLAVLCADGGTPVRDALEYLAGAIEERIRPRQKGGRGENTGLVRFGWTGLLHFPEFSPSRAFLMPGQPQNQFKTAGHNLDAYDQRAASHALGGPLQPLSPPRTVDTRA